MSISILNIRNILATVIIEYEFYNLGRGLPHKQQCNDLPLDEEDNFHESLPVHSDQ